MIIDYQIWADAENGNSCTFVYGCMAQKRAEELLDEIDIEELKTFGFTNFRIVPTEIEKWYV